MVIGGKKQHSKHLTPLQSQGLFHAIHSQLPQTQCRRCGFDDCQAYAQAIAQQKAPINRCQPGGAEGIARLAKITHQAPQPLAAEVGAESPRSLAVIDEKWCIGCTKCIQACPVDAIMGSNKKMHTILEEHCTGCELCLPVCPTDCIQLIPSSYESPAPTGWAAWSQEQAKNALDRYKQHTARRKKEQKTQKITENEASAQNVATTTEAQKHDFMAQILKKAQRQYQK